MTRGNPEEQLHRAAADYLALALPAETFVSTVGHGGGGKARGGRLKAMGVKAGVPDIFIIHRGRALFIELKAPKGRVSKPQIETHIALSRAGAYVVVCRSLGEIEAALWSWGIPLCARVSVKEASAA